MALTSIADILIDHQDVDKADLREYLKTRAMNILDFGAKGGGAHDAAALQAASDAAGTGLLYVPHGEFTGNFTTAANIVCDGFIKGTITFTGAAAIRSSKVRASAVVVDTDVADFEAGAIYIDGSSDPTRPGILTERQVKRVVIDRLVVENVGDTTQSIDATSFRGDDGDLLQVNHAEIRNCAYSGFTYGALGDSAYAYDRVILGTIIVENCGNTANPVGDNQHHGLYLSSARLLTFDTVIVRDQKRGYGIKFGSSVARDFGRIEGGIIDIDGITNGRGGITVTEPIGHFQVGGGRIHGVQTSHMQIVHAGNSGYFDLGSMVFEETTRQLTTQESILIAGDLACLDVSRCTFKGWLDGPVRRGIGACIRLNEGVTVSRLLASGTVVDTIAGHFIDAYPSSSGTGAVVEEISVVAPVIVGAGGVFRFAYGTSSATVQRGTICGIQAHLGTFTDAWVLPRAPGQLAVFDNSMRVGGTVVRLNDLKYGRMSNITQWNTNWVDSNTGVAIEPTTFDMQFPDDSLGDGYIGKVYQSGTWRNFGTIV